MKRIFEASAPAPRTWTHKEKLKLLRMKLNGCGLARLAKRYGVPPYEIRAALEDITQELAFKINRRRNRFDEWLEDLQLAAERF